MYQVNYNGLKKRESYDELVAIVEGDRSKIKYPNRYATFLSNSPYMKVIDEETLIDLQGQSLMEQKGQLKNVILKEISTSTGTPYTFLHAHAGADKSEAAVQTAQQQLHDIAVGDDDVEDFRDVLGESLDDDLRRAHEKKARIANLATQQLADMKQSIEPVERHAKETQTKLSTRSRKVQTVAFREEPPRRSMPRARMNPEQEQRRLRQQHAEMVERLERLGEVKRGNAVKREAATSSASIRNLIPTFSSVAHGISSMLHYSSAEPKRPQSAPVTPEGGRYNPIQSAKREKGNTPPQQSQMAKPVGIVSKTPSGHISIKSEPVSKAPSERSGFAQPVGIVAKTPSGRVSVRNESSSSGQITGTLTPHGMAQPVGNVSRTPSGRVSVKIEQESRSPSVISGMAYPVGGTPIRTPTRQGYYIASGSASSRSTPRRKMVKLET